MERVERTRRFDGMDVQHGLELVGDISPIWRDRVLNPNSRRPPRDSHQSYWGSCDRRYINLIDVLLKPTGLSLSKQACFCAPRGTRTLGLLVRNWRLEPSTTSSAL